MPKLYTNQDRVIAGVVHTLGTQLVLCAIKAMMEDNCDDVCHIYTFIYNIET